MYSVEHKLYLEKIKNKQRIILSIQIIITLTFILLWQVAAENKWINTFIFSSPKDICITTVNLFKTNNLLSHIWVTTYETIISFFLATVLGIIIATMLWWNKTFAKILDPYLTILNSLPKVALGPIIIIWFGSGIKSIIFMALLISLIITIINIYQGFINVDNNQIRLIKSFKATQKQTYFKLILPASINTIISTLKINISMSLIGVIMGEFLVSKKGIGYLILYGSQVFNLNLVISGIFILCSLASLMYYLVSLFEKKLKN